ncbi:MAG TPA: D-aminoacylase [Solirubrobacteraceae bacterium]|nr:D-aminoacylase [Solirubrobacteraceae bacterium]
MALDLVIAGGTLVDGDGARPGDVGVAGGRLVLGDLGGADARRIDAAGAVVAPGFIDTHTHSDLGPLLGPEHEDVAAASVRQGVTTEVAGNCGFSPFPIGSPHRADVEEQLSPLFGDVPLPWDDLTGYREAVQGAGMRNDLALLVGHGTLRAAVMGFADRPARDDELALMRRRLEEALDQGAVGMSSGLVYAPSMYAPLEELVELGRILARHGVPYTSHIRNETHGLEDAVEEALAVGRGSGAAVHLSHHKAAGRDNWGRTETTLAMVDAARESGMDVTLDVYPYVAGSTLLHSLLPPWSQEGGTAAMLERLATERPRIVRDVRDGLPGWHNIGGAAGWDKVSISACPEPSLEGRVIADLAAEAGADPVEHVCELLLAYGGHVQVILEVMAEEDVRRVLRHRCTAIGSDGIPMPGRPHPRWAGSFARVLGRYVREERVLELEDAVRKMTALPASRFGLRDRGRLADGARADLVVFDPGAVIDRATFEDSVLPPDGIRLVVVGGAVVVEEGSLTGARPGAVAAPGR